MNTKRQTIWLVSMLSLMVVLSAYYLFTEDVNKMDLNAGGAALEQVNVDIQQLDQHPKTDSDQAVSGQVQKETAGQQEADKGAISQSDQQILEQLESTATSGADYFSALSLKRLESLQKRTEELMELANSKEKSSEEVGQALEELQQIEMTNAKVESLEEQLTQDYKSAIVMEQDNKWKVIVQADKLEKSEAVTIADLVMTEMNIGPEKIQVQYIP
ncbi:SpoIIIAH-like family protein [Paenibacillus sp. SAFN-117]|uniref:SpoIIIAH-like family protein n=1 Tax=Paenibacillus sp. SAFN-117 TaxID=3436860 RepID=UPI003F81B798